MLKRYVVDCGWWHKPASLPRMCSRCGRSCWDQHEWSGHAQAADVWSCGVMLYVMLSAQYPFGRPEDTHLKTARQMHVMLQVSCHMHPVIDTMLLCLGNDSQNPCCRTTSPLLRRLPQATCMRLAHWMLKPLYYAFAARRLDVLDPCRAVHTTASIQSRLLILGMYDKISGGRLCWVVRGFCVLCSAS